MLIGALVFAFIMFSVGMFLWCKNAIKRKNENSTFEN